MDTHIYDEDMGYPKYSIYRMDMDILKFSHNQLNDILE